MWHGLLRKLVENALSHLVHDLTTTFVGCPPEHLVPSTSSNSVVSSVAILLISWPRKTFIGRIRGGVVALDRIRRLDGSSLGTKRFGDLIRLSQIAGTPPATASKFPSRRIPRGPGPCPAARRAPFWHAVAAPSSACYHPIATIRTAGVLTLRGSCGRPRRLRRRPRRIGTPHGQTHTRASRGS